MKLSSNKSKVNLSAKRGINLINHEEQKQKAANAVIAIIAIAVIALAIAKFGVIDQRAKVTVAEDNYNMVHSNYVTVMDKISTYKDVQSEYRRYSTEWLEKNEDGKYVSVNRIDVLNLIENELMEKGTIHSIMILDDTADVIMTGLDLEDISTLCKNLEKNDIVAYATLTQGATEEEDKGGEVIEETAEAAPTAETVIATETGTIEETVEPVVEESVEDEKSSLKFNIKIYLQNPYAVETENSADEEDKA